VFYIFHLTVIILLLLSYITYLTVLSKPLMSKDKAGDIGVIFVFTIFPVVNFIFLLLVLFCMMLDIKNILYKKLIEDIKKKIKEE